jgi:hypothetical protein
MTRPIPMQWDGEMMRPTKGFARLADKEFVVGEVYTLVEADASRSQATHRHYFAAVYECWLSLPDLDAERFPTAEHLRKYALIRAGYCDSREIVCASKAEAVRLGAFVKPMDPYALVTVKDACVRVYTAKSQAPKAMGRKVFAESKDAVLGVLAGMIEVSKDQLLKFDGGRDAAGGGESSKPAARAA